MSGRVLVLLQLVLYVCARTHSWRGPHQIAPLGGNPKARATLSQGYTNKGFRVSFTERVTGSYDRGLTEVYADHQHAPNRVYTGFYLSKSIDRRFGVIEPFLAIDNLFNVAPPLLGGDSNPGLQFPAEKTIYDVVGRYFTAGVRVGF